MLKNHKKGITLIEVLVGAFLMLLVFTAIFGAYQLGLKVISQSKNRITATAIANGELEKMRNLAYSSIGISGGYPDGSLQSSKNISANNANYLVETWVDYVIDSADGISDSEDDCPNDYKKVSVKVSWAGTFSGNIILSTDFVPKSVSEECSETGGVLSVSVFDAFGVMIPSPTIEIKDPITGIVIKFASPTEGSHYFSLAPGTYRVVVSKDGYSSESTFSTGEYYGTIMIATPEKSNPIILEGKLVELSFSIDKKSSFEVETLYSWSEDDFSDSFADESKISGKENINIIDGKAILVEESAGQYYSSGNLVSNTIYPSDLVEWLEFSFSDQEPSLTSIFYQVLFFDGVDWVLIPDSDLLGNSAGFADSPINLSSLDKATYPKIRIKAIFSTTDSAFSPELHGWQAVWKNSQPIHIPGVLFNLTGQKIVGKDIGGNNIYKYSNNHSSGSYGSETINDLEWDSYTFSIETANLNLISIDPTPQPISLAPDFQQSVKLYLDSENSLLLIVKDNATFQPIFSAEIHIVRSSSGYDETVYTNEQGKTYLAPMAVGTYSITIQAPGFEDYSGNVFVSGDKIQTINLERIE